MTKKFGYTFTAEDFDTEKLVLPAKNAGCKYITLATRYHEGFFYNACGLNDFDTYLEYLRKSIDILCTHYGKISGFSLTQIEQTELYATIRKP